jgi:hypothetical protein
MACTGKRKLHISVFEKKKDLNWKIARKSSEQKLCLQLENQNPGVKSQQH